MARTRTFYEKYSQQKAEEAEVEKYRETFKKDEIVIKKVSTVPKLLEMFLEVMGKILKAFLWILAFLLISLAVTVLINESTRNAVVQLFSQMF